MHCFLVITILVQESRSTAKGAPELIECGSFAVSVRVAHRVGHIRVVVCAFAGGMAGGERVVKQKHDERLVHESREGRVAEDRVKARQVELELWARVRTLIGSRRRSRTPAGGRGRGRERMTC